MGGYRDSTPHLERVPRGAWALGGEAEQGIAGPRWELPTPFGWPLAAAEEALSWLTRRPPLISFEGIRMVHRCHWTVTAAKARAKLGWESRPLAEGLRETLAWYVMERDARIRSRAW